MATLAELRTAVEQLLNLPGVGAALHLNSNTRERAYEAYVFSLMCRAVRAVGGTAVLHGRNSGPNPAVAVFRGAPGMLGSAAQDFAYARCNLGGKEFEVHVGVKYEGSSSAIHEADVSVYDHRAAERVRNTPQQVFPKVKKLYAVVECKFYDSDLGVSLGRTFVGLVSDCGRLV